MDGHGAGLAQGFQSSLGHIVVIIPHLLQSCQGVILDFDLLPIGNPSCGHYSCNYGTYRRSGGTRPTGRGTCEGGANPNPNPEPTPEPTPTPEPAPTQRPNLSRPRLPLRQTTMRLDGIAYKESLLRWHCSPNRAFLKKKPLLACMVR